jgi:hypothetical protein
MAGAPLSERAAAIYFEAVVAAILTTASIGDARPAPDNLIKLHKEMLQKLRAAGGPFD